MIPTKKSPVPSPARKPSAPPDLPVVPVGSETAPVPTVESLTEKLLEKKDFSGLTPPERAVLLLELCRKHALDPLSKPFGFLTVDGRVLLYAFKAASDGISKARGLTVLSKETQDLGGGAMIYTVWVADQDYLKSGGTSGRKRCDVGVVPAGLQGTALANAHKKAMTQALRRAILGLEAPGFLDESETEDIPGARPLESIEKPVGAGSSAHAKASSRRALEDRA